MDNSVSSTDSNSPPPLCMNGSTRRPSPSPGLPATGGARRPASLMDHSQSPTHTVRVVVNRDDKGYGMKVSGDNPVYVQSVKEGGAAEKAGLHAGDKIIKVNGVNVMSSTHTKVVELIKSSSQVELTVQQRSSSVLRTIGSPSLHNRSITSPISSRITGPQPVDNEKQHQLQLEKENHYRLMIENQQQYIDRLRSQLASSPDDKKFQELAKTERNLRKLQMMLERSQSESPNPTHHRTKSSPENLLTLQHNEGHMKLSESMNDLHRHDEWDTPPGTPPPPYPSPQPNRREMPGGDGVDNVEEDSPDTSFRSNGSRITTCGSPIHAATPQMCQQPIMSMEDDEISDDEISQLEDHGYFKSLSRLWEHLPHLAVFTNYILSNSDPNGLLFYLLTDLYKEGNAKEMRKWAFEIHSSFLVPGAPLRISNVDENMAREIDMVLANEFDKEEILRKIFWKARLKAKEELTRQLADFQQKRTAGLGTLYGPADQILAEVYHDKAKEMRLYESLFLKKLEPYLEEIDKENYDPKRYYTAAALTTVLIRIFQIRPTATNVIDRCPIYVNKEKSFRTKLIAKYSKKQNFLGHQFTAQQYYTVINCNNCHCILYGIAPQGYQCSSCLINLHRNCIKNFEDPCPGPMNKKDSRGIMKLIGMRHDMNEHRNKKSNQFLLMERDASENDLKQTHPVSRSGSDRRPDAVREEGLKQQDSTKTEFSHDVLGDRMEGPNMASSTILPAAGNQRKHHSNINRSESVKEQSEKRKQRRNISDPSHNTTSGDVDLERNAALSNTDSGSSSNSSISYNGRLSESPSNSVDAVQGEARRRNLDSDSDIDADSEQWQNLVSPEEFKNLSPQEKKRQDVINEFFHTESSHVRSLKVLYKIFYKKIQESQTLKPDELQLIFPNIKELLDLHNEFSKEMKRKRKEDPLIGDLGALLGNMFGERCGESLKRAAANFCERQQMALEFIKKRRERDSKFDAVLLECEKKQQCRRLPFQGILPTEMQRLSKYPLLLERLIHSVESNKDVDAERAQHQLEEVALLKRSHQMSKEILNHVNEAAKVAHNKHRLEEIQRLLDTSSFERADHAVVQEFRSIDLTKFRLILEGGMLLRRPNKPLVPVHILLLEEAVIILQKDNDKFLLKFFQSNSQTQLQPFSPIIKMNTLLARANAACKNALFLMNTAANNSQMYDLVVEDEIKREIWFKHFSDATEAYKKRQGKSSDRQEPSSDSESELVQDLPDTEEIVQRAEAVGGDEAASTPPSQEAGDREEPAEGDPADDREGDSRESELSPDMVAGGGVQTTKVSAEEWPLIQPSQVSVAVPPVHTAESMLTPLEQIRRKDATVKQALEDKEGLVADMLSIPREHFEHIADMASMEPTSLHQRDPSERVLASIFRVNQLQKAVNESLNVSEAEAAAAKGGKYPSCAGQRSTAEQRVNVPTVPTALVREIASSLNSQLTILLSEVKQIEDERDMLRKELYKVRERLHEENNLHSPIPVDDDNITKGALEQSTLNDSLQLVSKSDCEDE